MNFDIKQTSFPYRMLLKALDGKISEHKLEVVIRKYFQIRKDNLWDVEGLFPLYGTRQLKLINIYGMQCVFCGIKLVRSMEGLNLNSRISVEHILPTSKGGPSHFENYCLSCSQCNSSKMSNLIPNK
jgi:5-methylcytosine-specific restriction endonuclease McrA